jgi:hypothetical protein
MMAIDLIGAMSTPAWKNHGGQLEPLRTWAIAPFLTSARIFGDMERDDATKLQELLII